MRKFTVFIFGIPCLLFSVTTFAQINFTSSNLPIIIINTNGQYILDDPKIMADMGIIDNGPGARNNVTDSFNNYSGKIGIEFHGSSSQMFPKKSFGIEVRDATGNSINASLLGMPKCDDWILLAPYDDKSLMRDALAYKLGRSLGGYASRTRYCEVLLNGAYQGIYVLEEKIKRDKNRVNIAKLDPASVSGDDVTGGYILKIDKTTGSGGAGWTSSFPPIGSTANQSTFIQYEYPSDDNIVQAQMDYIRTYVNTFEQTLASTNFKDPVAGYAKYIDAASFIDYFILNEITKNPDAYRLSTFFYKAKDSDGGKLFMGPIWDFNEGFGNVNYCTQGNPEGFVIYFNSICPQDGWQIPFWWNRLFEDEKFSQGIAARWSSLRNGPLQTSVILNYVDSVASVLNVESQQRNFQQWPVLGQYEWPNYYVGQTFQSEVDWLKAWVTQRTAWLDENIPNIITGIEKDVPAFTFEAYPNPFAQDIQFSFEIDHPGNLLIDGYDRMGQRVMRFEKNNIEKGKYEMSTSANGLSPGIYFFKAEFDGKTVAKKMIRK